MTAVRTLAEAAASLRRDRVSEAAVRCARQCVLDYLGATIAGMDEGPSAVVRGWVLDQGGKGESTIIGTARKAPAHLAAMANGTAGHMIELDDVHGACMGHPGVAVISAALALAEARGLDGASFLAAVIAGYEVMARLGAYMGISHYKVWHPTGTLGAVGAAGAAIQALSLGEAEAENAIAIAATMASGLREVFVGGSNCKHVHPGLAARNGIVAAEMASRGFTGPESALDGTMGFRVAHSGEGNVEALGGIGSGKLHIEDAEFKVFASCRSAHTAAEAGIILHESGVSVDEVASVRLEIPRATAEDPAWGCLSPGNALAAKLSIPYNFAVSLADGACYLEQFTPGRVRDPELSGILARTAIRPSSEMDSYYPEHVGVLAVVGLKSGREATAKVIVPRGHPTRPVGESELSAKFLGLTEPYLGGRARRLRDAVMSLGEGSGTGEIPVLCEKG